MGVYCYNGISSGGTHANKTKRRDKMIRRVTPTTKDEKADKRAARNAHYKEMYQKLKRTRVAKGEKK